MHVTSPPRIESRALNLNRCASVQRFSLVISITKSQWDINYFSCHCPWRRKSSSRHWDLHRRERERYDFFHLCLTSKWIELIYSHAAGLWDEILVLKVRCRFLDSENLWCYSVDSKDNPLRCAEFLWSDLEIFPKVSLGLKKVLRQMHSWPRCSGNKFIPSMTRIGKQESCCTGWNIIFDKVHRAISSHKPDKINS